MKMKELLVVIPLILGSVLSEAPAPYPPSGYRPNGPAFELPQKQTQNTPQQQYLPALDPRRPLSPNREYGAPEEDDVSVQGLPTQEQLPIFQPSPISGQQYVGPSLQADLKNLDDSYRQQAYQLQQQRYREYERQRQLEAAQSNNAANRLNPAVPRFAGTTTSRPDSTFTTQKTDDLRTTVASTTEGLDLNEGETLEDDSQKKPKVSVEVSKQNLQEYPGEFFLSSLAQLQLQPQFVPIQQFGQLRAAPLYVQPSQRDVSQKQVAGYDAQTHFAALPSVLAQRQILSQPQGLIPNQQPLLQNPALLVARTPQPANAYVSPAPVQQFNQYQPLVQPQLQPFPQIQAQPVVLQPQGVNQPNIYAQPQPDTEQVEAKNEQDQPQYVYQQSYQPPQIYQQPQQPFVAQPSQLNQDQQNFYAQAQLINYPNQDFSQQYQNGFNQPQFVAQPQGQFGQQTYQGQDAFLQSGLDVNQQGNGLEQPEEKVEDSDDQNNQDGSTATSVATAFGARTHPRVFTRYGAPVPRPQGNQGYQTTTESAAEANTEDGAAVAEATAVASPGGRRKSAKLRSRRVRPIFTLDRSGHLVLAEQN